VRAPLAFFHSGGFLAGNSHRCIVNNLVSGSYVEASGYKE
jgi:hypothetical protein